jgi:hypothetical protein
MPATSRALGVATIALAVTGTAGAGFYDLFATDIDGNVVDFAQYEGTVSLVVNVASY